MSQEHETPQTEEELLDVIFEGNGSLWKGKYRVKWCSLCERATIGCLDKNCHGSSCNGGGCPRCHDDFTDFNKCKIHIEDYLTSDEIKILEKSRSLKRLILRSLKNGEPEINFEKMAKNEELSLHDIQMFGLSKDKEK